MIGIYTRVYHCDRDMPALSIAPNILKVYVIEIALKRVRPVSNRVNRGGRSSHSVPRILKLADRRLIIYRHSRQVGQILVVSANILDSYTLGQGEGGKMSVRRDPQLCAKPFSQLSCKRLCRAVKDDALLVVLALIIEQLLKHFLAIFIIVHLVGSDADKLFYQKHGRDRESCGQEQYHPRLNCSFVYFQGPVLRNLSCHSTTSNQTPLFTIYFDYSTY